MKRKSKQYSMAAATLVGIGTMVLGGGTAYAVSDTGSNANCFSHSPRYGSWVYSYSDTAGLEATVDKIVFNSDKRIDTSATGAYSGTYVTYQPSSGAGLKSKHIQPTYVGFVSGHYQYKVTPNLGQQVFEVDSQWYDDHYASSGTGDHCQTALYYPGDDSN